MSRVPVAAEFADAIEFGFDDEAAMVGDDVVAGFVDGSTEIRTKRFGAVLWVHTKLLGRQHHHIQPPSHPATSLLVPISLEISVKVIPIDGFLAVVGLCTSA